MADPTLLERLRGADVLPAEKLKELAALPEATNSDPRALGKALLQRGWLTRFQINEVAAGRGKSLRIGPYVVLDKLGAGGMGQVFKARHEHMGRVVALKVIRKEKLAKAESVTRFYQEVKAAAALIHPNIVLAYDAGPAGATHFYSMEYVEGTDLARLIDREGPLPVAQACEYIRQAALGLHHAHEKGLVHRDVKPSNVLVSQADGQPPVVKVLDLGLARLGDTFAEERHLTRAGQVLGTPDYLAPEQAMDARSVDARADLYSLGCTLFFLLVGRPPFQSESLTQLLLKHQAESVPSVRGLRPDVPEALDALLQSMLAKKPEQRPSTAAEVAAELEPFARGQQPGAGAITRAVPLRASAPPAENDFADWTADDSGSARSASHRNRSGDTLEESPAREGTRTRQRAGKSDSRLGILLAAIIGGGTVLLAGIGVLLYLLLSPGKPAEQPAPPPVGVKAPTPPVRKTKEQPAPQQPDDGTVFAAVESALRAGTTARSPLRGTSAGADFLDLPKEGALLTGLILGVVRKNQSNAISSVQPIYTTRQGRILGGVHGEVPATTVTLEAKPDHAIAAVLVHPQDGGIGGLSLVCMAIDGKRLDPTRSYQTGWVGVGVSPQPTPLVGDGTPIVGLLGKVNPAVNALGLVSLTAPTGPPILPPTSKPTPPTPVVSSPFPPDGPVAGALRTLALPPLGRQPMRFLGDARQALVINFKQIRLYDLERLTVLRTFAPSGHPTLVLNSLCVSPDGKTLAAGDPSGHVYLLDVESGKELHDLKREAAVQCLAFSPDGKHLAVAGGGVLHKDGKVVRDDNNRIVTGDYGIDLWDVETGTKEHRFTINGMLVTHLTFAREGKMLVAGSGVWPMQAWDVQKRQAFPGFRPPPVRSDACLALVDQGTVLLGGGNGDVVLWDLAEAKVLKTFRGHSAAVQQVAVVPGGKQFVSVSGQLKQVRPGQNELTLHDATVRLWDASRGVEVGRTELRSTPMGLDVSPDGSRALVGEIRGVIRLLDLGKLPAPAPADPPPTPTPAPPTAKPFAGHTGVVTGLAYSPDGKYLLSGGKEGVARLWDAKSGKELRTFSPGGPVNAVCFSGNGKRVGVFASRTCGVYECPSGTQAFTFPTFNEGTVLGSLSDTGTEAVITGSRWYRMWKVDPDKNVPTSHTQGTTVQVTCTAWSPDGYFFAYGDSLGVVRLRSVVLDAEVGSYAAHAGPVTCLAVQGGKVPRVVSGGTDKVIVLRSGKNLTTARRLTGHEGPLTSLSLSADGKLLSSGSLDRTVRLWSLAPVKHLHKRAVEDPVLGVALAPDGKTVAHCGIEGIQFWDPSKPPKR
jgi:serine/threonine protein kinase/WD40 repeat protein